MEGLVIDANDRYTVQEDGTVTVGGLAVGETVTFTASYTVTADDILVGTVVNAATVSGDDVEDPKNPDEPKTPEGGDETEVTLAVDVPGNGTLGGWRPILSADGCADGTADW